MKIAGSGAGSGSVSQRYGSADPDQYQNVTEPQHCFFCGGNISMALRLKLCRLAWSATGAASGTPGSTGTSAWQVYSDTAPCPVFLGVQAFSRQSRTWSTYFYQYWDVLMIINSTVPVLLSFFCYVFVMFKNYGSYWNYWKYFHNDSSIWTDLSRG